MGRNRTRSHRTRFRPRISTRRTILRHRLARLRLRLPRHHLGNSQLHRQRPCSRRLWILPGSSHSSGPLRRRQTSSPFSQERRHVSDNRVRTRWIGGGSPHLRYCSWTCGIGRFTRNAFNDVCRFCGSLVTYAKEQEEGRLGGGRERTMKQMYML